MNDYIQSLVDSLGKLDPRLIGKVQMMTQSKKLEDYALARLANSPLRLDDIHKNKPLEKKDATPTTQSDSRSS